MKSRLLTDTELRARWSPCRGSTYDVEEGTILTPAARDFLREQNIQLRFVAPEEGPKTMPMTPIPVRQGKAVFVNAATGEALDCKPEEMTHLRGNLLVSKTHPRIVFRGKLDSLTALLIEVQLVASETGDEHVAEELEELLGYVRCILASEVKDTPLPDILLLGLDADGLRYASHQVKETLGIDHPVPCYRQGRLCAALNRLRTQVREAELAAAQAFTDDTGICRRVDIVQALNRLSSCVYIMFCRKLAGCYDGREHR